MNEAVYLVCRQCCGFEVALSAWASEPLARGEAERLASDMGSANDLLFSIRRFGINDDSGGVPVGDWVGGPEPVTVLDDGDKVVTQ